MTKEEKYRVEAQEFGFMFLGDSSCGKYNYRKYSCEKGHISDYQTQHMRRGNCTCTECYPLTMTSVLLEELGRVQ